MLVIWPLCLWLVKIYVTKNSGNRGQRDSKADWALDLHIVNLSFEFLTPLYIQAPLGVTPEYKARNKSCPPQRQKNKITAKKNIIECMGEIILYLSLSFWLAAVSMIPSSSLANCMLSYYQEYEKNLVRKQRMAKDNRTLDLAYRTELTFRGRSGMDRSGPWDIGCGKLTSG